jgi:hypothetical protein
MLFEIFMWTNLSMICYYWVFLNKKPKLSMANDARLHHAMTGSVDGIFQKNTFVMQQDVLLLHNP